MPHIHEKIDFVADVFIVYKDRVLIRKHDKYDKWLAVGGHIELDEDPNQAAIREVKEEVGLDINLYGNPPDLSPNLNYKELIPPIYLNQHRVNPTHEHITLTYFALAKTSNLNLSLTEKSEAIHWFTEEDLLKYDLKEDIRFYAQQAL